MLASMDFCRTRCRLDDGRGVASPLLPGHSSIEPLKAGAATIVPNASIVSAAMTFSGRNARRPLRTRPRSKSVGISAGQAAASLLTR
jgi:hypothetical protein